MPARIFGAFLCLSFALGCSSDDDDDDEGEGGKYAGIVEWRCFEGDDCWCAGLTRGNEANSSDPQVDACSYTTCFVYRPFGDSESWHCSCGPDGFMLLGPETEVSSVPACPPQ